LRNANLVLNAVFSNASPGWTLYFFSVMIGVLWNNTYLTVPCRLANLFRDFVCLHRIYSLWPDTGTQLVLFFLFLCTYVPTEVVGAGQVTDKCRMFRETWSMRSWVINSQSTFPFVHFPSFNL
jgi:hypothetical protein